MIFHNFLMQNSIMEPVGRNGPADPIRPQIANLSNFSRISKRNPATRVPQVRSCPKKRQGRTQEGAQGAPSGPGGRLAPLGHEP